MTNTHLKYIDDLTLATAMNLKETLVENPNPSHPTTYHDRTMHLLPKESDLIQQVFNRLQQFSSERQMVINRDKTKAILFNSGRNFDFLPEVKTNEGETLEVEETKLLGIIVRSDLSWQSNTKLFCEKGYSRLWILRNLKRLGANRSDLALWMFQPGRQA